MTFINQETIALHTGQTVDPVTRSRAVPLYQTTSYVFETLNNSFKKYIKTEFSSET